MQSAGNSSQVQQPARIEAVLSSRHLPSELGTPVSTSAVPTVRDEEAEHLQPQANPDHPTGSSLLNRTHGR
jgi:hypothetical protein